MFNAKVYKIAIFSLSGTMEEIYAAKEMVGSWNKTKAESAGKMYMLVDDAQSADVLVGIIGNRLENQELVDESLKDGRQVLLFFNEYADPKNTIASEQKAVKDYRIYSQDQCVCSDYNGVTSFRELLNERLDIV